MGLLDDYFKADKVGNVNKDVTPYDGDTVDGLRIGGVDAPEAPTYTGHSYKEGVYHQEYTDMLDDAIQTQGYDRVRDTGEKSYERPVVRLETKYGSDYADEYTREGLLGPSRFAIDDINIAQAHSHALLNQAVNGTRSLPAWKQAELLTKQALGSMGSPVLTSDQLTGLYAPSRLKRNDSGSFSIGESAEYWWLTNKSAIDGLYTLFDEEEGRRRIAARQREFGERIDDDLVVSLEQVDGVGDAFAWLGNNLVIQGPDYAIMAGGASAGAAIGSAILPGPGTVVGGFIGGLVGVGYNYLKSTGNYVVEDVEVNDEVNMGNALAVGAGITLLDRLGARSVGINPATLFTKEGKQEAAQALVDKGIVDDVAEGLARIDKEAFSVVRDLRKDFVFQEASFLTNRQIALGTIREIGKRTGEEALTEGSQELLQYLTIHGTPVTAEDWKQMGWRLADAAAAGGAVGGVYSLPRSLKDRAGLVDIRNSATSTWSPNNVSSFAKLSADTHREFGDTTLEDQLDKYDDTKIGGDTLDDWADKYGKSYFHSGLQKVKRGNIGNSSVKAMFDDIMYDADGNVIPEIAIMANAEGAVQTLGGGSVFNTEKGELNRLEMNVPWMGDPGVTFKDRDLLDKVIRKMSEATVNDKGEPQTDPSWTKEEIEYANIVATGLRAAKRAVTQQLGFTKDDTKVSFNIDPRDHMAYYLKGSLPSAKKIKPHQQAATDKLAELVLGKNVRYKNKKPGDTLGRADASQLINNIIENKDVRETARDLHDLGAEDVLKEYYEDSAFDRMMSKVAAEIISATRDKYRGRQNNKYAQMINSMVKRGVLSEERAQELAFDLRNQIDKHAGTFGRMKSDKARNVQNYLRTATTLGVLDKSAFAQIGEAVWSQLGQNKNFLQAVQGIAYGWFDANRSYYTKARSEAMKDYKYYGYEDDTALQHGAAYEEAINQNINKWFFRLSQNAPLMEATRMDRMAGFAKVLSNLAKDLDGVDLTNLDKMSDEQIEAYEMILRFGGRPTLVVESYQQIMDTIKNAPMKPTDPYVLRRLEEGGYLDPTVIEAFNTEQGSAIPEHLQEQLFDLWNHMVPKFVDDMVVRVKPGSRPAVFEDQRWGLPFFTQYLTYTSHWHANQLPRIYEKHIKGGSSKLAYSAFALAATAIVSAYYAQFLKDWITYGEESPHLSEGGDLHRALLYSGLFGWAGEGESRFIRGPYGFGAAAQAFSSSDKSLAGELLGSFFESPTISHVEKVGEKIGKGQYQDAAERFLPGGDIRPFRSKDGKPMSALDLFFSGE